MPKMAQEHTHNYGNELPLINTITPLSYKHFSSQREIYDIYEQPIARLEQSPAVFMHYLIAHLRQAPRLDQDSRHQALQRAAEIFASASLCGMTPTQYCAKVCLITGLPQPVVDNATSKIAMATASALKFAQLGIPYGVPLQEDGAKLSGGSAQSIRRGDVLAVITPGNGTGVHALWPQAIALGYRVVIRPSEREPWTAQRLVAAMVAAGLQDYVALLPCDYEVIDALTEAADLSLLYGGDALMARFSDRKDVLVQGPGRSKIVIGADYPLEKALQLVFESVCGLGGAACVCASSVIVEGDAQAFAQEFCNYLSRELQDEQKCGEWLARLSPQRFKWWKEQIKHYTQALIKEPQVLNSSDNTYLVMPLVMIASSLTDPLMQLELPVASVTFASFKEGDDLNSLAPALVITVASSNPQLIESISNILGVRNLYVGHIPTIWMHPRIPHDGYLSEFLMTTRGYCVRTL
ncbi:aldehyde dehydrogenase family protein [Pantoea sp. FN0307]|uniref:aldehyde dehydrogenase family protein n=1 Tax=Pantoea sp. FN0307 TaxID=3418560 RepID=UPI003CF83ED2